MLMEKHTDVSTGFSQEILDAVSHIASQILTVKRDHELIQRLTVLQGYRELMALQPHNANYQLVVQQAAVRMIESVRRSLSGNMQLIDRLEKALGGPAQPANPFRESA
jgi:hypothetical protein